MNRMTDQNAFPNFGTFLRMRPHAWAWVEGSEKYPNISGRVRFYQTALGVLTAAEFFGLPTGERACDSPIFGFHIHENGGCTGTHAYSTDPFSSVGMHYNPWGCPHPYHAGDLPPLFSANGYAFSVFLSDRFTVEEIIGRSVIVHSAPDDFTTQPSGNSGDKIACGEIRAGSSRFAR